MKPDQAQLKEDHAVLSSLPLRSWARGVDQITLFSVSTIGSWEQLTYAPARWGYRGGALESTSAMCQASIHVTVQGLVRLPLAYKGWGS